MLDEEMVVVTSAARARNLGSPLMFRDLVNLPLILPSKRNGLRQIVDRIAENEDLDLSIRLEVDSVAAIEELVRNSDWVTVLPAIAVGRGLSEGTLRAHHIVAPRVTRQIVCVHNPRRPLSAAARLFIEVMTAELLAAADVMRVSAGD
jgi:DNA-binding transcriptional LysR family regulator